MTLSLFGSDTRTNSWATIPASATAGDLCIFAQRMSDPSSPAPAKVIPTGFTEVVDTVGTADQRRCTVSYKILVSADKGVAVSGMTASTNRTILGVWRESSGAISSLTFSTPVAEATAGNPAAQAVSASNGTAPLIVFAHYGSTGNISPNTFSPAEDGTITSGTIHDLLYKMYDSSPANHTVDMDDEGTMNFLQSWYMELTIGGGGGPIGWDPEASTVGHTANAFGLSRLALFGMAQAEAAHTAAAFGMTVVTPSIGWDPDPVTVGHTAAAFGLTSQITFGLASPILDHTAAAFGLSRAATFGMASAQIGHTAGTFDMDVPLLFRMAAPESGHTAAAFGLSKSVTMGFALPTTGHRATPYIVFVPRQGPFDFTVSPRTRVLIVDPENDRAISVPVEIRTLSVSPETRLFIVPDRAGTVIAYEDRRVGPDMRTFTVPSRQTGRVQRQGSGTVSTTPPSTSYILLEDGNFLLQEDGSNLKL